jgi:chromosome segregation ATPase
MGRILKGIAIAAGTGVGLGLSATLKSRLSLLRTAQPEDRILHLEPLFDRFDRAEARLEALENRPTQAAADFDRRLTEQESALRELRAEVDETDRRLAAQAEIADSRFVQLRDEIPPAVEAILNPRMAGFEASLRTGLDAQQRQNLENLEEAIDQKITERISALERTLAEQSASITVLRQGAQAADANLHRLIGSVERLCEAAKVAQAQTQPVPVTRIGAHPESFQNELTQAVRYQATSGNGAPDNRKPRVPMARIFVALLTFGMARFLR